MKLYDEINRYGLRSTSELMAALQEDFFDIFPRATVVDVTNVQNYLQSSGMIGQEPFDLPNFAPMFPVTFFEFWTGHGGPLKGTRIGLLVASWDRDKDPDFEESAIPSWQVANDRWSCEGRDFVPSGRWKLWGMAVSSGGELLPRNIVSGPECSFTIEIERDGSVCRMGANEPMAGANFGQGSRIDGNGDDPFWEALDRTAFDTLPRSLLGDDGKPDLHRVRWGGLKFSLLPCFFANSLMHCRNVELNTETPDFKLSRAFQRRSGKPLTKFYTLSIGPIGSKTEARSASKGIKIPKSLHICRGHFSTYTEDKPLFGKYAGQFWIPAHVRGSEKVGRVFKDYSVEAPSAA